MKKRIEELSKMIPIIYNKFSPNEIVISVGNDNNLRLRVTFYKNQWNREHVLMVDMNHDFFLGQFLSRLEQDKDNGLF